MIRWILPLLFLSACSTEAPATAGAPPACNVPDNLTTVIDRQCTPDCVVAHAQPSHFRIETEGSIPLSDCTIELDDVHTLVATTCEACP